MDSRTAHRLGVARRKTTMTIDIQRDLDTSMFGSFDTIDSHGSTPHIYVSFRVSRTRIAVRLYVSGTDRQAEIHSVGEGMDDLLDLVAWQAALTRCMNFITVNKLEQWET